MHCYDIVFVYARTDRLLIVVLLIGLFTLPGLSQQPLGVSSNEETIKRTLIDLTPVEGKAVSLLSFARLTGIAIALEQTHAWKSPASDRIRQLLPDRNNKQILAALHQLLANQDTAGAVVLQEQMRSGALTHADMTAGMQLLMQAGFRLALDALLVTTSSNPQEVITALIRISPEKRSPLEAYLYDRNNPANNPLNYIKLTQTALEMYNKTPVADKATCDELLHFLTLFGFGSSQFNLNTVGRIYAQGNAPGALYILQWLLTRYPDDTTLQANAYRLIGEMGCSRQEQVTLLRWMSESLQPQYARRIRHDLYALIAANQQFTGALSLDILHHDADKLIMAESYLATQQFAMATTTFTDVINNAREPLPRRLAAWSGLWDSEPDNAVAAISTLTNDIFKLPAGPERTALLRWFGAEMGRVAPFIANGWTTKRPKATQPACYTAMAASITRLLTNDPVACLRLENANGPSLRYAASLIYTLAKQGKKANAVMAQAIEYKECPRPGTRYAVTAAKLQEEMTVASPRQNETDEVMKQLVMTMELYDKSFGKANTTQIVPEPPNTTVMIEKCAALKGSTDAKQVQSEMRSLAAHFALAVSYLDPKPEGVLLNAPPPDSRHVNLEYMKPVIEAIDNTFANPLVCQNADQFVQGGLQPSMLSASNAELLDAIFNLSISILDKSVAAKGKVAALKSSISNYANYLEGRQVWNLKPYADKLRAIYLATP